MNEIAQQGNNIQHFLEKHQNQIAKALPKHIDSTRMARVALTECRKNPKLLKADPKTLFGAFIECSQLGLEPGGGLGHAYILPFENKREGTVDVQLIIGYKGMIDLARRSGQILSLQAHAVYEKDYFEFKYGLNDDLQHIPSKEADRGEMIAVYAVAKLVGGGYQFQVMHDSEIQKLKESSMSYKSWVKYGKNGKPPIWVEHYAEMAKKTVIRRLFKYLPVSVEIQRAVNVDELSDTGNSQQLNDWIDTEYETKEEPTQQALPDQQGQVIDQKVKELVKQTSTAQDYKKAKDGA